MSNNTLIPGEMKIHPELPVEWLRENELVLYTSESDLGLTIDKETHELVNIFGERVPEKYRHTSSMLPAMLRIACEHIIALEKQVAELKARLDTMDGGK